MARRDPFDIALHLERWLPRPSAPRYERRPDDGVRVLLGSLILAASTLEAWERPLATAEINIFRLVNELPDEAEPPLYVVMQLGSYGGVLGGSALALLAQRPRLARDLFVAGNGAYWLAKVVKKGVTRGRPFALLEQVLVRGARASGLGFPSGHAATSAALATAASPYVSSPLRDALWGAAFLTAIARIFVGAHLPADVVGGAALGWALGAATHLAGGVPVARATGHSVAEALSAAGLPLAHIAPQHNGATSFRASSAAGQPLEVRPLSPAGHAAGRVVRWGRALLLGAAASAAPFGSPKRQAEHEGYMALLAARAGVRTPAVLRATATPEGQGIVATERLAATPLAELPTARWGDGLLAALWAEVARLHEARIAHRDLRPSNVLVDEAGGLWLAHLAQAEAEAPPELRARDVALLLAALAQRVGAERAVASALGGLAHEQLVAAMGHLHERGIVAALHGEAAISADALRELQQAVARHTGAALPTLAPTPLPSERLRTAALALAAAASLWLRYKPRRTL